MNAEMLTMSGIHMKILRIVRIAKLMQVKFE
jgi:hypothetical protein